MENAVDTIEITKPEVIDTTEAQKAYERVTNPDKAHDEPVKAVEKPIEIVEPQTEEAPPVQTLEERVNELQTQVARVSELEKQIEKRSRDDGGRYGALKQTIEQLQKNMPTAGGTSSAVDVEDVLAEVKEAFGDEDDLYKSLKSAFSKALASNGRADPEAIEKIIADRIAQADKARDDGAVAVLEELHSDYRDVIFAKDSDGNILLGKDGVPVGKPEYFKWQETLTPTAVRRLKTSTDPYFAAEMLDQFKDWDKTRKAEAEKPESSKPDHQKNKERLNKAVLPTSGTKSPIKPEMSAKEIAQAAYDRVAGKRL